jgi:hypothetical protein
MNFFKAMRTTLFITGLWFITGLALFVDHVFLQGTYLAQVASGADVTQVADGLGIVVAATFLLALASDVVWGRKW